MNRKFLTRIAALFLAVALAGCSAPQPEITLIDEPAGYPADASLTLVDNSPAAEHLPLRMETPSANDENVLAGVINTSSIFLPQTVTPARIEVKSVWVSYLEYDTLLKGKTRDQFTANIRGVFDNVRNFGFNTVIVQVRPFGDALYDSALFPWSSYITGTEGRNPGFDPLEIMVREARARNLRIEAWVNPYRIRAANNSTALSGDNPAKRWIDAGDTAVIRYGNFISYNPASQKARALIVDGIVEIVNNYDIDAIHIDDYFYPTTDAAFDRHSYNAYTNSGGRMQLADWRRNNVELLLKEIYAAIKRENPNVLFGISPQGNISNNFHGQYIDVRKILSEPGYLDYICPQIYFGFQNQNQPFAQVLNTWSDMITVPGIELYVGLAPYKIGVRDNWAGNGVDEWLNTSTQMRDMVQASRDVKHYNGFVMFRYDSMFRPHSGVKAQMDREMANLKSIMDRR